MFVVTRPQQIDSLRDEPQTPNSQPEARNLADREGDQGVDVGVPVAALHGHPRERKDGHHAGRRRPGGQPYTLQLTPYTLHPTTHTPIPYTLNPTPYTLHPTPYTMFE